jgi:hypothetical protein
VSEFADSHDSNIPAHLYSQPSEVVSYIPEGAAEIVPEDIDEMPEDVRTAVGDTLDITATDDEFEEAASPLPGRELTEGDAGVHQRFDGPTISEHLPVPEMHLPQAVDALVSEDQKREAPAADPPENTRGDPGVTDDLGKVAIEATTEPSDVTGQLDGEHDASAVETEILDNYAHFETAITAFDDAHQVETQPLLGKGAQSTVHLLEVDGKKYAMRTPLEGASELARALDTHLSAAVLVRQLPEEVRDNVEWLVAASRETYRTIAKVMPGEEINELSPEQVSAIPDKHLEKLIDTLVALNGKLKFDPNPRNFLYDGENGFGVLDLGPAESQSVGYAVGIVGANFMIIGRFGEDKVNNNMTAEDYAHQASIMEANYTLAERYAAIVARKLDGENLMEARTWLNPELERTSKEITEYRNPEWVSAQIEKREASRRLHRAIANGDIEEPPALSDILD